MGEPQRSDDLESDRRSSPRFPAELLGKASVRLLGGSEVTLINFSERGLLFQSETRLLVGARGTVRIVVGTETTVAAGTVVRSLVQGMASGKLAFHTALALDQPLMIAAAVEARERAKVPPPAPTAPPVEEAAPPAATPPAPPPPAGKTIEKKTHKGSAANPPASDPATPDAPVFDRRASDRRAGDEPAVADAPHAEPAAVAAPPPHAAPAPEPAPAPVTLAPLAAAPVPVASGSGFGDTGFDSGSFGWSDSAAETSAAGLSVLFVSTSKERTARLQGILADHRRDIVLTTMFHSKAEALADIARQHDVLLFDFAIGPEALERTLSALRSSPLGASIAIFVPQQTALPPAVSSLANACVVDTTSGNLLAAALRDAAWTPWQPVEGHAGTTPRDDFFWKAFDALPVPVLVVDAGGTIVHANAACAKLADGADITDKTLASFFVAEDAPAIAALIEKGLAGGHDDTPLFTAPADGTTVQVMLQSLSVLPGSNGRPELALRCELREAAAPAPAGPEPEAPDYAGEIAALTASRDELSQIADTARGELIRLREEIGESRNQVHVARRERDDLRGQMEIAQRDLERMRELDRAGAAKIAELERVVADAARAEVAAARAQTQLAAATEEISTLRHELEGLRLRSASQGADAERTAVRHAALETSARQAIEELKLARTDAQRLTADAQRLTRERDQALAAVDAERARADAALAAVRDDSKKSRKIGGDDAAAHSAAKLQRQIDELRAEVKQEQDARRELEELLDQNAENLEQTIQDYEAKLEALGAGAEDKRTSKPKKRQG